MPQPEEQVKKPVEEAPPVVEEKEPVVEELPNEVLPPDDEAPVEALVKEPAAEPEPTAADLRAKLEASEAENARLREGKPAEETPATQPGQRVSMSQVYLNRVKPEARKQFIATKDSPEEQFEVVHEMANQMLGAVMTDRVEPLSLATVGLYNEMEIRDLRSDAEFKALEPKIRAQLNKTDWKARAQIDDDGMGIVTAIFHRMRGAQKNGAVKPAPTASPKSVVSDGARKALKDISSGGGASPKPSGIRLTKEQESDYQNLVENGWPGSRAEYYAKWKGRADQAKAQNKPIPKTYRG